VQALAQSGGALAAKADGWRAAILALMAAVEADIDFADEDDVAAAPDHSAALSLATAIEIVLADRSGERIRDGFTVALVGAPNSGKSSLLNALAKRDVAIVSDIPGTTRDSIEVALDIGGIPFLLVDTAGLRDSEDPVEQEGIRRTRVRVETADLVLHLAETLPAKPLGTVVLTKSDLLPHRGEELSVSALTGEGIPILLAWLHAWATAQLPRGEPALVTRARHRAALTRAAESLHLAASESDPVLHAEALRLAARALAEVTGRVGVEDVLGEIFGRFCIGK
jgi:tRNA modification GTPase